MRWIVVSRSGEIKTASLETPTSMLRGDDACTGAPLLGVQISDGCFLADRFSTLTKQITPFPIPRSRECLDIGFLKTLQIHESRIQCTPGSLHYSTETEPRSSSSHTVGPSFYLCFTLLNAAEMHPTSCLLFSAHKRRSGKHFGRFSPPQRRHHLLFDTVIFRTARWEWLCYFRFS